MSQDSCEKARGGSCEARAGVADDVSLVGLLQQLLSLPVDSVLVTLKPKKNKKREKKGKKK